MHDNVANKLAENFYRRHGAEITERALETQGDKKVKSGLRVMTSRFCIRRELGFCLKTPRGKELVGPLTLVPTDGSNNRPLHVDFDCKNCQMHLSI